MESCITGAGVSGGVTLIYFTRETHTVATSKQTGKLLRKTSRPTLSGSIIQVRSLYQTKLYLEQNRIALSP